MSRSAPMNKMLFFFISSVQYLGGRAAKRLNFCEGRSRMVGTKMGHQRMSVARAGQHHRK